MTRRTLLPVLAASVALASPRFAVAAPNGPAETSLDRCQNALRSEGVKYVQGTHKAIATCLGKVSTEVLRRNAGDVSRAVAACMAQFHRIGRNDGQSMGDRFTAKVTAKCEPAPANAHTLDDLLGSGAPGVAEPLDAMRLGQLCAQHGGDGSVDSFAEWLSCMRAAQDCAVHAAVASEFPRSAEWLAELADAMPPSYARTAALAAEAAIDGPNDDGAPSVQCGASGGQASSRLLVTGQKTCWGGSIFAPFVPVPCAGTGHDGEVQAGEPFAYVDNGDGTITDLKTGLMWEKKSDDGTLHDVNHCFPFHGICAGDGETTCFRDADCAAPGGPCDADDCQASAPDGMTIFEWLDQLNAASFAGYDDWRIPNRRELDSLVDLDRVQPAMSLVFDTGCAPGCTVTTCSCDSQSNGTWSSTTYAFLPDRAWVVFFSSGDHDIINKGSWVPVRAVRGGD